MMSAARAHAFFRVLFVLLGVPLWAQVDKPVTKPAAGQEPIEKPLSDAKDATPSDFARFVAEGDGGHFDTAITTYRNKDGVTLRLFAAVHIADAQHYAALQQRFHTCGRLLYELVGPEDYRPKKGEARGGFISMLQQGMKNGLELEFQLDGVDYGAANFVHADMTPEEFASSMEERGESLLLMMWQIGMNAQKEMMSKHADDESEDGAEPSKPVDIVEAFRSGEGRHQLRLMMAAQLEGLEAASSGAGSTLLEGRNEKCLAVLQREIAAGQKDLGIYYGAAHFGHMEKRLTEDLGFQKIDHEWLVAWDCKKRADPKVDRELWKLRRKAKADVAGLQKAAAEWLVDGAKDGAVPTVVMLSEKFAGRDAYWSGAQQDPWGRDYVFHVVHFGCDVQCLGEDGAAGTADDIRALSPREWLKLERSR